MSDKNNCIHQIGEVAGCVWQELAKIETTSISKLTKSIDCASRRGHAGNWMVARENKIEIVEKSRGRSISLSRGEQLGESNATNVNQNEAA